MMTLFEYRRLALMALLTGLIATLGIAFVFIPNVELVILTAFLAGVALGPKQGLIVAVLGEAIFSALNPIGSGLGFPILFALQIFAVGLSGLAGGLLRFIFRTQVNPVSLGLLLGLTGFLLTLNYDILTSLSMPLASGVIDGTIVGTIVSGLVFFVMHMLSNTILFAVFGPPLATLIQDQMSIYRLDVD